MYAEERQQHIVDRARREGRVDVAELAAALGVTSETVRRDLSVLERDFRSFLSGFPGTRILYAVKANPHPASAFAKPAKSSIVPRMPRW